MNPKGWVLPKDFPSQAFCWTAYCTLSQKSNLQPTYSNIFLFRQLYLSVLCKLAFSIATNNFSMNLHDGTTEKNKQQEHYGAPHMVHVSSEQFRKIGLSQV